MRRSSFDAAATAAVLTGLLALGGARESAADTRGAVALTERFTATTTAMTPRDLALRIDLREWSSDDGRAAVVAALADASTAQKALADLPTVGNLWQAGSGVGYSVKYAHRAATSAGERVTFVTSRRLGAYDLKPWAADGAAAPQADLPYSVVELYLSGTGQGDGSLSIAAPVAIDAASSTVTLADGAPRVLSNAKAEPNAH